MGLEISAIDAFAPMARISLEHLLGPSPPIRTLGKTDPVLSLLQHLNGQGDITPEKLQQAQLQVQAHQAQIEKEKVQEEKEAEEQIKYAQAKKDAEEHSLSDSGGTTGGARKRSDTRTHEDEEVKDNGMWSPSRILTILPTDSQAFELVLFPL